ncbi:hypothetical protein OG730_04785 [Streptomyces sp. NBC_01298]|nr:hypothetical protein OG730_04785 [Streptomyces sp. NBC_01298]
MPAAVTSDCHEALYRPVITLGPGRPDARCRIDATSSAALTRAAVSDSDRRASPF